MRWSVQSLVSQELYHEALSLYSTLHSSCRPPTTFTFPPLLKACGKLQSAPGIQQLHAHIISTGSLTDTYTATALTSAYSKIHSLDDALKLFDEIPQRSLPLFNSLISGFSQNGWFHESLRLFRCLQLHGFQPNSVTIASVLPACRTKACGSQLHGLLLKLGHELDVYVRTSLLTMLLNCGELDSAEKVFQFVLVKKVVSYNALLSGYLRNGLPGKTLAVLREMMFCSQGRPNASTFLSVLTACSDLSALCYGKQVHCYLSKHRLLCDVKIGTALVDMYLKCGRLMWAYEVFTSLDERNLITYNSMICGFFSHGDRKAAMDLFQKLETDSLVPDMITWNLVISGYTRHGNAAEAFRVFNKMQLSGVKNPSLEIFTSLLEVSAVSNYRHGKEIHAHVIRTIEDGNDKFFHTTLAHFYMKYGSPVDARHIFDCVEDKSGDQVLWNVMISGHGRNGEDKLAIKLFEKMLEGKVEPNSATFLSILSVCAHAGHVEKGWKIFRMMHRDFSLMPKFEHFGCMVDLLGRAGRLYEAWDLLPEIPEPQPSVYFSLLGACQYYSNAELGSLIAERISEFEPGNPTPFVILCNIYADQGRWDDVKRLREKMMYKGLKKDPGCSWTDAIQQTSGRE